MPKKKPTSAVEVTKEGKARFTELREALTNAQKMANQFAEAAKRMQAALDWVDDATKHEIPVTVKVKAVAAKK